MLEFIDKDLRGEKINPVLKFVLDQFTGNAINEPILQGNVNQCRYIGIWIRSQHFTQDIFYNLMLLLPLIAYITISLVPNFMENVGNFPGLVENLSYTIVVCVNFYMVFVFMANANRYENIIHQIIRLNQQFSIGMSMFAMEKKIRFGTNFFLTYCFCALPVYLGLPYFMQR